MTSLCGHSDADEDCFLLLYIHILLHVYVYIIKREVMDYGSLIPMDLDWHNTSEQSEKAPVQLHLSVLFILDP